MPYEPSLKVVHAFLDPETALSQVEDTIELANRVYDSVFHPVNQGHTG